MGVGADLNVYVGIFHLFQLPAFRNMRPGVTWGKKVSLPSSENERRLVFGCIIQSVTWRVVLTGGGSPIPTSYPTENNSGEVITITSTSL